MSLAGTTRRQLARKGRPFTLRRMPATTGGQATDVTVQGYRTGFASEPLPGGLPQGQSVVIISNAEIASASWPGPPRKGDRLLDAERTMMIESVETIWLAGAVDRHLLRVVGG
jgi:hypothetical protein